MEEEVRSLLSKGNRIVGTSRILKELPSGKLACVILAKDVDDGVRLKVEKACFHAGVPVKHCSSKEALGRACGIDVSAAAVGIAH